jgi:dihydroorotate dehydrogenase electron transfer subunit
MMKHVAAEVRGKTELFPGIFCITAYAPDIASTASPGQFVMVDCGKDTILRRPISIHRITNKNELLLLFRNIGTGTNNMSQIKKGETVDLIGPLGNGFEISGSSKKLLLIAGGMGIAPLVFLAEKALKQGKKVTVFLGTDTASQLYPRKLLPHGTDLLIATEDGSKGKKGLITDFIPGIIDKYDQAFACGPVNMYKALTVLLESRGYQKQLQVSLEVRMGCGFGICYGCTIKTETGPKQVCKDGPVFNIKQINWEWVKV